MKVPTLLNDKNRDPETTFNKSFGSCVLLDAMCHIIHQFSGGLLKLVREYHYPQ